MSSILAPDGLTATDGKQSVALPKDAPPGDLRDKVRTARFYETHRDLVGTDVIVGLKAYRLRNKLNQEKGWLETVYSPTTGFTPLRIILHRPDGSEKRIDTFRLEQVID